MSTAKGNIPNNNQKAIKTLAIAGFRANRGRNTVLIMTVALSILVLCTVFGIALGKVEAEYLQCVRTMGTAATTYLENGTMEQYKQISSLSYIKAVGRVKNAGSLYEKEHYISEVEALDETAWEELEKPAYTHIQGTYPSKQGEVMVSQRGLENLGISDPKIGMEIPMTMQFGLLDKEDLTFTLCGWYTDYADPAVYAPVTYISEAQLKDWGMSLDSPDRLLLLQKNFLDGYEVEARLYEDVAMTDKAQQFVGGSTYQYTIINAFTGGYQMAVFCSILVLVSVFFLIRNIMSISIRHEIRQIGLLNTLGTTRRQICGIYIRQVSRILLIGGICGSVAAALLLLLAVPRALGNLYLYNFGRSAQLHVFRPGLFVAAIVFTICIVWIAVGGVIARASGFLPLEAMHYTGISSKQGRNRAGTKSKIIKDKSRFESREILQMAGRNLLRYKKRCILTVLSLFLGMTTALGSVVLTRGTDRTNAIEQKPDFSIGGNYIEMTEDVIYNDEYTPIRREIRDQILSIKGVKTDTVQVVRGAYVLVDNSEEFLRPLEEALGPDTSGKEIEIFTNALDNPKAPAYAETATVQIVDDAYIEKLKHYVEENHLTADVESLKNGTGVVMLHYHLLSPTLQEEADRLLGLPVTFWQLRTPQEEEALFELIEEDPAAGYEAVDAYQPRLDSQLQICGYLDTQAKGFPELKTTWMGPGIWYFLISETGFERLQTSEKTFGIDLNAEKDMEPSVKAAIQQIIQEENRRDANLGLFANCKSDDLAEAQGYITTNRIIMGALSFVLILMGLLNYFNIITTEMLARKRELSVMESIGMTGRQIRHMLMIEGGMYCGMVAVLVFTAGNAALHLLHVYMDTRISYFKFTWPWPMMIGILAVLFVLCVTVPVILYRKLEKESLPQRIAGS